MVLIPISGAGRRDLLALAAANDRAAYAAGIRRAEAGVSKRFAMPMIPQTRAAAAAPELRTGCGKNRRQEF